MWVCVGGGRGGAPRPLWDVTTMDREHRRGHQLEHAGD